MMPVGPHAPSAGEQLQRHRTDQVPERVGLASAASGGSLSGTESATRLPAGTLPTHAVASSADRTHLGYRDVRMVAGGGGAGAVMARTAAISSVRSHHEVKSADIAHAREEAARRAVELERVRIRDMRAASDAIRSGSDVRMLPLGETSDHIDAALATKVLPALTTFNAPRVQDSLVASVFGETQVIVHAFVDAFAASGAVCRVDHADPNLKLNISVPVRGDFGIVDVRFACIGPPRLKNHCVAMEVPVRLTSVGARIELREALKASLAWVREHRGIEASCSADSPSAEPDDGVLLAYSPMGGGSAEARPMLSAGAALVADATAAQLAPFKHGATAGVPQASVSAAVLDVLTKEPEASVLPALATRVVEGSDAEAVQAPATTAAEADAPDGAGSASSSPQPAATAGATPVSLRSASTSATHSEDAPGEDDLAHALPRELRRIPSPAPSPAASPAASTPASGGGDPLAPSASASGLFAESSEHIRGCLRPGAPGAAATAASSPHDAVPALRPLASAVQAGGPASTSALATASRLILAQPIGSTRATVRSALDEAGVPRAAWELLARLGAHHAEEEAKAGGHAATRAPAVAGRVMQEAAGQLGLSPSGLCIALQGALVLGPHSAHQGDAGAASPGSPASRAAIVHAVKQAANRWAILPESDDVAMVQIQRSATELADALDSDEGMLGHE